jgi:PAS domain S-box-containing protein
MDTLGDAVLDAAGEIVDSLDVGIVLQDRDGRAHVSNQSARRILGLSAEQLAGRESLDPRWALMHEDGWPLPPEDHPGSVAIRNREPVRDSLVGVKQPGGAVRWTSVNAHPLFHEGEERPHAVVLAITDVTATRAARLAERSSHDRFRSLIEHSSDVVTIVDDRGRVTYESPAVEPVLGYAPGELVGPGRLARVHPDDLDAALTAVTGLIGRPGESVSCEYRIKARDGRWRVLESVATNRLHDPAVLGIVINTRDVTERRETEAALRATTARLENLVQNLHAGVLVEDGSRRIAVVNSDLCRAFGIEAGPEFLLGSDCAAAARAAAPLMAEPDRFVARIEELITAGRPVHGEEVAFADGRTFERDYIPIASGRLDRGHLWIYRDISRRKEEAREAARLRDEAIRASRLKSEFLATMSHEIRTPMSGVIATLELLLDTELEPHQRDLAGLVRDATYGLLGVLNDALDLSRLEAEKLEPRADELDVAAVAEGVGDVVLSAARRKGLGLSVYVDPAIPQRLRGDAQWLRQVLVNLAGNAVKFTGNGEVRIRASLLGLARGRASVRFAVADTGAGIPEAVGRRLFEPFVQLDPAAGGTGLGLAICERLARLMGGEIEVRSEPGRGAEFSFDLELVSPGEPGVAPNGAGLRVLVVEPAPATAAVIADYLTAAGVEVQTVHSAGEACRVTGPFDVAIVGVDEAGELGASRVVRLRDVGAPGLDPFDAELTRPVKRAQLYEAVFGARAARDVEAVAGARVLVAEDDEVNRELLVRQLVRLGVRAEAVTSGRAAAEAVLAGGYDAVLMDAHMPDVDGLEAARAIRAIQGERGAVPIVAVTGGGTAAERDACIAAGMNDFVLKPVTSSDLARALGAVLAPRGAIDTAAIERLEADLGDRAELRRIAGIYMSQLGPLSEAIAGAGGGAGDHEQLRRAAHRLGSASATFGATRLAELCRKLELDGQPDLAPTIVAECRRASEELRALLA